MSVKLPEMVLWNALVSDASVTFHVGHKIYPHLAPAVDDLPFINWRRRQVQREQTLSSPMGVPRITVDFAVFAETYLQARQVADAMRAILDGYTGSFDNTLVRHVSLEDESDEVVSLDGSEVPNAYSVVQTYDILWQET
jgi:hypothetical protein